MKSIQKTFSIVTTCLLLILIAFMSCTQPIKPSSKRANNINLDALLKTARAVKKPFPQNIDYPGCLKPQSQVNQDIMNKQVKKMYVDWVTKYVKPAPKTPGAYYVWMDVDPTGGNGITSSEAHGYGMLTFAMMAGADLSGIDGASGIKDAKEYYDGLFKMFKAHPSGINPYLMSWVIGETEDPSDDSDSATDGDLDIAYSLVMAHDQWGSDGDINYILEAQKLIMYGIKPSEMCYINKRVMLGDWSVWTSYIQEYGTRSSDWMAGHFRVFEKVTGDRFWTGAINEIYDLANKMQNEFSPETGLVPDFILGNENPRPAPPYWLEAEFDGDYAYNACRFPWRIAMDYAHYGEPRAKIALDKISNWLITAHTELTGDPAILQYNPGSIVCGYHLNGEKINWPLDPTDPNSVPQWSGMSFTAPFTVACMVGSDSKHQDAVNKGWWEMVTTPEGYYEDSINLLCALALTGNWWKPAEGYIPPAPTAIPRIIGNEITDYKDRVLPSHIPPLGMDPKDVPMLVSFGWDDNEYEPGMQWAINVLNSKQNPAGNGVSGTFDGTKLSNSFFHCSWYTDAWFKVTDEWNQAESDGHEMGNHSWSHHPDNININTSAAGWRSEIQRAGNEIAGAGISSTLYGWRTPFLAYNQNLFPVLKEELFEYDCSIEEGFKWGQDGTNCYWPYTLNNGSPGHDVMMGWGTKPFKVENIGEEIIYNENTKKFEIVNEGTIGGLWEMAVSTLTVPPFEKCPEYGIDYDMRAKFHELFDWFSLEEGKITGFDFNLWFLFNMLDKEALATLKYSLDLRLLGNRAPLLIGSHTGEYTDTWQKVANDEKTENNLPLLRTTPNQRQRVIEDFIAYAQSKPDVRIVSYKNVLDYCRNPVDLKGNTPTPTPDIPPPTSTPTPTSTPQLKNLAPGKIIKSSSSFAAQYPAINANDSNPNTVWGSATNNTGEYIYIDLGEPTVIQGVKLRWYNPYFGSSYQIYVSDNATNWTLKATIDNGNGGLDDLVGTAKFTTRYVGIYLINANSLAYGLTEFEVWGFEPVPVTPTPTMTPTPTRTPRPTPTATVLPYDPWAPGVSYAVGSQVLYENVVWTCTIAHTSIAGWYPGAPGIYFWEK